MNVLFGKQLVLAVGKSAFGAKFAFWNFPAAANFCFELLLKVVLRSDLLSRFDSLDVRIEWISSIVLVLVVIAIVFKRKVWVIVIRQSSWRSPWASFTSRWRIQRCWSQGCEERSLLIRSPCAEIVFHVEAALLVLVRVDYSIILELLVADRTHVPVGVSPHAWIIHGSGSVLRVLVKLNSILI